jgi:RNA polymerase sigma-70 factor, ECF subfamily
MVNEPAYLVALLPMYQNEQPDHEFLSALQASDPEAFRRLVKTHKHRVLNICYHFVRDPADAEEVSQDVFVEVYRSVGSVRGAEHLDSWLCRVAVSRSLNFLRRQKRLKRGGLVGRILRLDEEAHQVTAPAGDDPHERLEQREREQLLQDALGRLSGNQRVAFTLSQYDGMSYEEIAAVLKCTPAAVESLIHRAKANLRKQLKRYYQRQN